MPSVLSGVLVDDRVMVTDLEEITEIKEISLGSRRSMSNSDKSDGVSIGVRKVDIMV